jgi:3-mercaptopyruvate sulfurtransferase SseA
MHAMRDVPSVQAAHDFFTLLGFNPVLYEGSFFEWSNAPGTPVETSKP